MKKRNLKGQGLVEVLVAVSILSVVAMIVTYTSFSINQSAVVTTLGGNCSSTGAASQATVSAFGNKDLVLPAFVPLKPIGAGRAADLFGANLISGGEQPTQPRAFAGVDFFNSAWGYKIIGTGASPAVNNSQLIMGAVTVVQSMMNADHTYCSNAVGNDVTARIFPSGTPQGVTSVTMRIQPYDLVTSTTQACPAAGVYLNATPRRNGPKPTLGFANPANSAATDGFTIGGNSDLGYLVTFYINEAQAANTKSCSTQLRIAYQRDTQNLSGAPALITVGAQAPTSGAATAIPFKASATYPPGYYASTDSTVNFNVQFAAPGLEAGSVLLCKNVRTGVTYSCNEVQVSPAAGASPAITVNQLSWNAATSTATFQFTGLAMNTPPYEMIIESVDTAGNISATAQIQFNYTAIVNRVFVTSTYYGGDLGGLAGADRICLDTATTYSLGGGPWRAYLSTSTTNAKSRIVDTSPWYAVDSMTQIFPSYAALTSTGPIDVIQYDNGTSAEGERVLGATNASGVYSAPGGACGNWLDSFNNTGGGDSSFYISSSNLGSSWVVTGAQCQGSAWDVLCVEQVGQPTPTPAATHNRVFMTASGYNGNLGGLAGADSICSAEATAANLGGGPWKAWLSTSTVNAITRLGDTSPWYSVDGVHVVFPTFLSLTDGSGPTSTMVSIHNAFGQDRYNRDSAWFHTGTVSGGTYSGSSCSDWTVSSAATANVGAIGNNAGTLNSPNWVNNFNLGCNSNTYLLCFEQFGPTNTPTPTPVPPQAMVAFNMGGTNYVETPLAPIPTPGGGYNNTSPPVLTAGASILVKWYTNF